MKKQYTKPAAQAVALFAEGSLLTGSPVKMYDDGTNAGFEALSGEKAWSSSNWTDEGEE